MAWRAGCRIANMEFIQFHPTCLYHPQERSLLITEALRGEGAWLTLPDGTRFMAAHDPRMELAPRDIVARAIDFEMKKHGLDHVWLDATHLGEAFLKEHFPTVHAGCLKLGIDIARQPIPVVPAAHYTCGGVVTDLDGRTDMPGPVRGRRDRLHGTPRRQPAGQQLAAGVRGGRPDAAPRGSTPTPETDGASLPAWDESRVENADEQVVISHNWDELRLLMWDYVGIVRTTKRLERALRRIRLLRGEIDEYYADFRVNRDLLELRNLVDCAELVVRSALSRHESRGLHFSRDYPYTLPVSLPTVLLRGSRDGGPARPARRGPPHPGQVPGPDRAPAGCPGSPPRSRASGRCSPRAADPRRLRQLDLAAARGCLRAQSITPCTSFIAIHGQCEQLRQVALSPAVGRLDQRLRRRELAHPMEDAAVGGDDVLRGGAVDDRLEQLGGRADDVRLGHDALGRFRVDEDLRVGMLWRAGAPARRP